MTDTFFVDTSGEFVVSKAQSMPQDESQALLQSAAQYYRLTPKKDPLKQIMQSYFPLQEEKDDRIYGAIDGALRQYVSPDAAALARVAKALFEHNSLSRDLGSPRHARAQHGRAQPRDPERPGLGGGTRKGDRW